MTANSGGVRPPVRGPDGETAVAVPVRHHWRVLAWLTLVVDVLLVGLPFPILMFAQASGLSALASIAFPMLVWGPLVAAVATVVALWVVPAPRAPVNSAGIVLAIISGGAGLLWLGVGASFGGASIAFGLLLLGVTVLLVVLVVGDGPHSRR